jgi:hypothetical protein
LTSHVAERLVAASAMSARAKSEQAMRRARS